MEINFVFGTPNRPEFVGMFGGWLVETPKQVCLIDCGVGSGGPDLVRKLKARLSGRPLDYVFLSHIHMDHAGGLADIMEAWPGVRAVVHEKGLPHLVDPAKLWDGTRLVMAELASMYGRPRPVDSQRLISHKTATVPGLEIFETPGHAPHHLSYRYHGLWFGGEAAGTPYFWKNKLYVQPGTSPRYFHEVMLKSICRLLEEPDGQGYFGHTAQAFGLYEICQRTQAQLNFWNEFLSPSELPRRDGEEQLEHLERLLTELIQVDPELYPFRENVVPDNLHNLFFVRNAVRGFLCSFYPDEAHLYCPGLGGR